MAQLKSSLALLRRFSTLGPTDIYVTSNVNLRRKAGIKPLNGVEVILVVFIKFFQQLSTRTLYLQRLDIILGCFIESFNYWRLFGACSGGLWSGCEALL
jgi:hypothetical protein